MPEKGITNTNYFPLFAVLTDENNEIDADVVSNGKPLDELLAKKFKLSRPTVRTLLSTWEKEGRIEMEKYPLSEKIKKIRILNIFCQQKEKARQNRVLVLLDLENLYINFGPSRTMIDSLKTTLKQIAQEIGPIAKVFVFTPFNTASYFAEDLYRAGIVCVLCPEIKAKDRKTINTTDQIITDFGKELIDLMPGLTHLCLGSGDIDFASGDTSFPSLLTKADHFRLDIAIIASDIKSLSSSVIKLVGKKPDTDEKMIYLLPKP